LADLCQLCQVNFQRAPDTSTNFLKTTTPHEGQTAWGSSHFFAGDVLARTGRKTAARVKRQVLYRLS
jgi:hypothetical protein